MNQQLNSVLPKIFLTGALAVKSHYYQCILWLLTLRLFCFSHSLNFLDMLIHVTLLRTLLPRLFDLVHEFLQTLWFQGLFEHQDNPRKGFLAFAIQHIVRAPDERQERRQAIWEMELDLSTRSLLYRHTSLSKEVRFTANICMSLRSCRGVGQRIRVFRADWGL